MHRNPRHPGRHTLASALIAALTWTAGCSQGRRAELDPLPPQNPAPESAPAEQKPRQDRKIGCVVMIPGVIGQREQLDETRAGLREAGVDYDLEVIDWGTSPFQPIENLTNLQANIERAERIAARITELRRRRPDQPIVLLGKSGGGGLAILAVQRLPADVQIDRLILIASAISQDYDLARVRAHCKDRIINFHSPADQLVSLGTLLFGTIDRRNAVSAGHSGFVDEAGRLRQSEKLMQISWEPSWLLVGHHGGHTGYRGRAWVRHYLAQHVDPSLAADRNTASGSLHLGDRGDTDQQAQGHVRRRAHG